MKHGEFICVKVREMTHSGRIPQSVLIEGSDENMRNSSAEYLAAAMVCSAQGQKPCGECRDCRKAFSGIHPDITVVGDDPKRKIIPVDSIRSMRREAYLKPNEADARVFVIKNADTMNETAQNALLKLLEEPPEFVGIILCAASRSRLISTVRSRLTQISTEGENAANRSAEISAQAEKLVLCAAHKDAYGLLKLLHNVMSDRVSASNLLLEAKKLLISAVSVKRGADPADETVNETASLLTVEQLMSLCDWCDDGAMRMNSNANRNSAEILLSARANRIIGV